MKESKTKKLGLQNYKPLREVVFEYLRNSILNGELEPGERLMELQLAEQLGVSRTPIREAIRKLELEGLVEMIPRKGAYVADLSIKDVLDVLEVRMFLEGLAAYLAAERMSEEEIEELKGILEKFENSIESKDREEMIKLDKQFHDKIIEGSKNSKLMQIVQGLHEQFQRFRVIYFNEYSEHEQLLKYHQAIVEAISKRDCEKAQEYAQTHIAMIEESILSWKKKNKLSQ
ncbi:transcriptional regulator, GntR family [Caminicella sporogenes DSM 14501]|uniref:Transcriptional regulator, GntR family n=1 Tax=Caminicella sporogenes DSM 14501 TaxID=1121266 RepID=A0A1M6T319_9FIRM|nr:GntR family transcriptional regulator [Caminicella sporogenes]RKD25498.1 GntR family transcriptional regulator [Caminicella sporogenes]SHK51324.1 transcriptional regulator, GntR family [Caminicella sporogenes DSM 14501]